MTTLLRRDFRVLLCDTHKRNHLASNKNINNSNSSNNNDSNNNSNQIGNNSDDRNNNNNSNKNKIGYTTATQGRITTTSDSQTSITPLQTMSVRRNNKITVKKMRRRAGASHTREERTFLLVGEKQEGKL